LNVDAKDQAEADRALIEILDEGRELEIVANEVDPKLNAR
jgi:hypothetical protein